MTANAKIWVTGAHGFLGAHVLESARSVGPAAGLARRPRAEFVETGDLERPGFLANFVREERPRAIIHTAAWADAGRCFRDPAGAWRINAEVPGDLARACREGGTRLIHVSTDLVFDGEQAPYGEDAEAQPTSVYGATKLGGEEAVLEACPDALVVRIPLLFGDALHEPRGASAMLEGAMSSGKPATLFVDEWRSPLAVEDVARELVGLVERDVVGRLHVASRDAITRYELGLLLAQHLGLELTWLHPCRQVDVPSTEKRPRNVSLDVRRALDLGLRLPSVRESVTRWRPRRREA